MQLCITCAFHINCVVITTLLSAIICYKILQDLQVYKRRASAYRVFSLDACLVPFVTEVQVGPWTQISCCMSFTSLGVYRRAPIRDSQRPMFFLVNVFLDDLQAITAIGTAYKCTDADAPSIAIRVLYAGKAEARSCHQCLVPSLSSPLFCPISLSLSLSIL